MKTKYFIKGKYTTHNLHFNVDTDGFTNKRLAKERAKILNVEMNIGLPDYEKVEFVVYKLTYEVL